MQLINLPLLLTLIRLLISPLLMPVLCVYLVTLNNVWYNGFAALCFILLSLTDFFDGYLARKHNQETVLGVILDPIADKFLVYSTLIGLLVAHKIMVVWVVLLIGREFFMMSLRQIALEYGFSVPVSFMGKLKTTLQMIWLTWVVANPYHSEGIIVGLHRWVNCVELFLLIGAVGASLISAYCYYRVFMKQFFVHTTQSRLK